MTPHAALREYFGYPAFRPGQEAALAHVLAGRDTLVVMPTGSGKSIIYQLAGLLSPNATLVISPLVALMKDQIDSLERRGLPASYINSTLPGPEQSRRLRAFAEGHIKILLIAPERLRSRAFRGTLARVPLSVLAIDEAHCLSQWGHDFRPDYLQIAEVRREFNPQTTLALTATATPRVQDDIVRMLGLARAERIITGFNRPNLTLEVLSARNDNTKLQLVREFLSDAEGASAEGGGIIYVGRRKDAEEVAAYVAQMVGLEARAYHAGMDTGARAETQDLFLAGDLPIIVATNAFGMGIDRPDVRWVLHYTMPGTLEAYYQEAGRAGRDGLPARCVLLYSPRDTSLHEFFIENDSPSEDELRSVYGFLRGDAPAANGGVTETGFALEELQRLTQLNNTKVRVALEQLEVANAVRRAPDQAYGYLQLQVGPLDEKALKAVAAQVQQRRRHKRAQLGVMVDYAETNICRRRTILDHFGDTGPADAPVCCDNCLSAAEAVDAGREYAGRDETRPAKTQPERAALIVLDTIARLKWEIGKSKLAQVLKGSTTPEMASYRDNRNFGKFADLPLTEIETLIAQLLDSGYVKQVGSDRPTLRLSPRGESALKTRTAIKVDLRPVRAGATQREKAKRDAGGTVALTGQLLARGLSPEQIAAERGVTLSTVYSHLAQLIAAGRVDINRVVPASVQKHIHAAIERVGPVGQLAPLKALVPDNIDYNQIRCVVEAWKLKHGAARSAAFTQDYSAAPRLVRATEAATNTNDLFERLRVWRMEKARSLNLPPFAIFSDETLRGIVTQRPRAPVDLLNVRGIGRVKLEQYGAEVLAVLNDRRS
ncbi:MAG: RecQ family ATP-dependent DNA helicase [Anaerolineales bacterium]